LAVVAVLGKRAYIARIKLNNGVTQGAGEAKKIAMKTGAHRY
jgi:hypothetical protein